MSNLSQLPTTMIGFGEAARAFVSGWAENRPKDLTCTDLKFAEGKAISLPPGVTGFATKSNALTGAAVVFSLVTADQALVAAEQSAAHLAAGALWLDGNSCAPETKRTAARVIEAAGGRYVDMAIMAPVHPKKHRVPILLSGPFAETAAIVLAAFGMSGTIAGQEVGQASTIKMLRSVMIKGFEALSAECFLAARKAGVEADVIASLQASDPGWDWAARGAYNLERMMVHGTRRAAEMREVARTVADLGLTPAMASATVDWQDRLGGLGLEGGSEDILSRLDRILARL